MLILITYDVSTQDEKGAYRLRQVAKVCMNYGQRVQKSVFECIVTPAQVVKLESLLSEIIDVSTDSIRIYRLGSNYSSKILHIGANKPMDLCGTLIF